jgi:probable addiction module antidote protein
VVTKVASSLISSKQSKFFVNGRKNNMDKIETSVFDPAEYIVTEEDVIAHLEAAFEDGHPSVISDIIGAVARSQGMAAIAAKTGLSRESLYRALSPKGNPKLSTLVEVLAALGLRLSVVPLVEVA